MSTPNFPEPGYQQPVEQGYASPPYYWAQPVAEAAPPEPRRIGRDLGIAAAIAAVIALLGLGLGLIWSAVAPSVPAVRMSDGAVLAQPEQEQMIAAEGWYIVIMILAGIAVAVLAWVALRRYRGLPVLFGLVVGTVAAGLLAYWLGHHIGLAHARYLADHAAVGTNFSIPPNLRAQEIGLWHGWLPLARGDVLTMAITSVITYILLAGFSPHPDLRPTPGDNPPADAPPPAGPPAPGQTW